MFFCGERLPCRAASAWGCLHADVLPFTGALPLSLPGDTACEHPTMDLRIISGVSELSAPDPGFADNPAAMRANLTSFILPRPPLPLPSPLPLPPPPLPARVTACEGEGSRGFLPRTAATAGDECLVLGAIQLVDLHVALRAWIHAYIWKYTRIHAHVPPYRHPHL